MLAVTFCDAKFKWKVKQWSHYIKNSLIMNVIKTKDLSKELAYATIISN